MANVKTVLIIAAATIGSGVFALPYLFETAGWALCLLYYLIWAAVVIGAQAVYLKTLEAVDERERLLGLARKYFGRFGFWVGFFAIVVGLLLSFVIFLLLGSQFVHLLLPQVVGYWPLAIFWFLISVPVLLRDRRATNFEMVGVVCVAALILFIFIASRWSVALRPAPPLITANYFLPLGIILFTLAGWTGVEPVFETRSRGQGTRNKEIASLAIGTILAVMLYILFTVGILNSAPQVVPDTISGLVSWPVWKKDLVALVGLVALWTVSMPIAHEIRNALEKDLKWNPVSSKLVIIGLPLAVVLSGLNNFLTVLGFAGGVFISIQYLLIVAVGRKTLRLSQAQKALLDVAALVFLVAAVYSVYAFI
ncbi:MAG: hypothetical protein KGJ13_00360 [Patescibacteria group bacterium]|nr:hypothetical protein [Patescibacteria group bacterium]